MIRSLHDHPFSVQAYFKYSATLTFAVPVSQLQALIPECLKLDTFNDEWAFLAVAMVQTEGMRPAGFPKIFGKNFFLIGFRVFVRYTTSAGKRLRGLYILRSYTDKKFMQVAGNIFTHYHYNHAEIHTEEFGDKLLVESNDLGLKVEMDGIGESIELPAGSPFQDWKEARRFAGPLPFTYTYNAKERSVLIIEGVRSNWHPVPLKVTGYKIPFLDELQLQDVRLASAFIVKDIPYQWRKGVIDRWNP